MSQDLDGKVARGPSGRFLGRITGSTAQRFCVDVEGKLTWLPLDVIFSVEDDQVTLIFEPYAVERYALRRTERRARKRTG